MCPSLDSSPPDVLAAIFTLPPSLWRYPLVMLLGCAILFTVLLWRTPQWAQGPLVRRFSIVTIMLVTAMYLYTLGVRWGDVLTTWHNQVMQRSGFLTCQLTQLDSEYYQAMRTSQMVDIIMVALLFLAGLIGSRALRLT